MVDQSERYTTPYAVNRRRFLQAGFGATAGLSGVFALRLPPAVHAQQRELSVLTTANYVPASDKKLQEQLHAFAKQAGVSVKIDHLRSEQMPANWQRK
jgi:spermidine/putrescine-binding protein